MGFIFIFSITNDALAVNVESIKVGVYDNEPKVYLNDKNMASGLFPDILNYIAQKENWKLDYVFGTWEEGLNRLKNGEIDIMVDVAFSSERKEQFDFTSMPVFYSWGVVYVGKDYDISSLPDLNNKKIAILDSSIYYKGSGGLDTLLRSFGFDAEFVKVSKQSDVFDILNKGEVQAGVVSQVFALSNKKNYSNIKKTNIVFTPTELMFALTKGGSNNQYLIEKLDYWVRKLKEDDTIYRQILERNGLLGLSKTRDIIPLWVFIAGFCGMVILILSGWLIIRLKHAKKISLQKLKESAEFYKMLIEAAGRAGIGFVILQNVGDKEGLIVSANDYTCKISGYFQDEILKKSIEEFIASPLKENILSLYRESQNGKITINSYETEIIRKDKIKIPVVFNFSATYFQGKIATVVYFRDILEKKLQETKIKKYMQELHEGKSKDDAILDSIAEGLFVVDLEGKIVLINQAFENILGWKLKEIKGKRFVDVVPAEDNNGNPVLPEKRPISISIATKNEIVGENIDYFILKKDKTKIPISYRVSFVMLDNKVIGAVGVFRDVTKEKELDKAKAEFLSLASHQLRTPLSSTKWILELFLQDKGLTKKAKKRLNELNITNQRLIDLVDMLLDVTKIESDKLPMNKKVTDIRDIIENSCNSVKLNANKKNQKINILIKIKLSKANVDPLFLGEALNNILNNSISYGPENSVIDIVLDSKDNNFVISVHNAGPAISENDQINIFEKFYRGVDAQIVKTDGTGLGLYFTKKVIEANGGTIWFDSNDNFGTTFYFTIPQK
jgi:PAS domain S-box-containing protein